MGDYSIAYRQEATKLESSERTLQIAPPLISTVHAFGGAGHVRVFLGTWLQIIALRCA